MTTDVEVSFYLCGGCVPSTMKVQAIATFTTISGTPWIPVGLYFVSLVVSLQWCGARNFNVNPV